MVSLLKTALPLEAIIYILSLHPKLVTYKAWKVQALTYEEIELEKKTIHHFFSVFNSKPHNSQNQPPSHSNFIKAIQVLDGMIQGLLIQMLDSLWISLLDKLIVKEHATYVAKLGTLHMSVLTRKYRLKQFFML